MNRKIAFATLILVAGIASPALAVGVRIDPDGAPAAASVSPAQLAAQVMGYNAADIGGALDPNG